jgi:hypothetical protein
MGAIILGERRIEVAPHALHLGVSELFIKEPLRHTTHAHECAGIAFCLVECRVGFKRAGRHSLLFEEFGFMQHFARSLTGQECT